MFFVPSKVLFIFVPRNVYQLDYCKLPERLSYDELTQSGSFRKVGMVTSTLQRKLFFECGTSTLSIWVPNVPKLLSQKMPFLVCLVLEGLPSTPRLKTSLLLSIAPKLQRAKLFLQHRVRITAQRNTVTLKIPQKNEDENILNQIDSYSNDWTQVKSVTGESIWQKFYIWKGFWTCNLVPNFSLSQISLTVSGRL